MKRIGGWLWAIVFMIVVGTAAMRFSPSCIHTDIRALLPVADEAASAEKILAHSSETSREIWILVGAPNLEDAAALASRFSSSLSGKGLDVRAPSQAFDIRNFAKALSPYRDGFLSSEDKNFLSSAAPSQLLRRSLSLLYRPFSASFVPFQDDPLGTFENALTQAAPPSGFEFSGPCVSLKKTIDGLHYCVLSAQSPEAMTASGSQPLTIAIRSAQAEVLAAHPQARIHAAGVPLISEEAASKASAEASLIGSVSTIGIVLLVVLFFSNIAPLLVTLLVVSASLLFAAASVLAVFGQVHVLTLVFGATLLGICVDYVFHMLCAVATGLSGPQARAKLIKPLSLSLLTTCIGYAVMIASPMPGLQQMAVFCTAGLFAAYVNVVFVVSGRLKASQPSAVSHAFAAACGRLPCLQGHARTLFIVLLLAVSGLGALQLKTQNELTLLNRISPQLLAQMQFIAEAVSPVSPGQLFVVSAADTESVLAASEKLNARLTRLADQGIIGRALNPCALLPSQQTQTEARELNAPNRALALKLAQAALKAEFPAAAPADEVLTLKRFQTLAPPEIGNFWLNETTLLVPLAGVTAESLPHLRTLAREIDGVRFVNTTEEVAESLARYRNSVFYTLVSALIVIAAVLAFSLKKKFLAFWLPTLLSVCATLGVCGFLETPFSLFTVLPLVLVVGLGVDYAIVLYGEQNAVAARNSVFLAAASTLLAFGLLAFSTTPALHLFGQTLLIAMTVVLITTVLLRPHSHS